MLAGKPSLLAAPYSLDKETLVTKMRILILNQLALTACLSATKSLEWAAIATALEVPVSDVQLWVMNGTPCDILSEY